MRFDLDNLPSDVGLLHQLVRDMASLVDTRNDEIERFQAIITKLQLMQFGRRSERLDPDQLALGFEDLDADIGRIEESRRWSSAQLSMPLGRALIAAPCPIIRSAKKSSSMLITRHARAAVASFMR